MANRRATNPAPARSDADRARYLARVVRMNPLEAADEIVALRNRFRGVRPVRRVDDALDGDDLREQRERLARQIDRLRADFWSTNLDQLRAELAALDLDRFPDLKNAADRLSTLAAHRHELPRLVETRGFDRRFFEQFRQVLVLPPRQAGEVREKVLAAVRSRERLLKTQKMVELIRRETPALYALEAEWLGAILGPHDFFALPKRAANEDVDLPGKDETTWWGKKIPWWAMLAMAVAFLLVVALVGGMSFWSSLGMAALGGGLLTAMVVLIEKFL